MNFIKATGFQIWQDANIMGTQKKKRRRRHSKNIDIPAFINDIKNSGLTNKVCKSVVRSLNSKIYRLSNLLDKSAKLCMNDLYGIYFKSVRGAHENTAYFIFYEFLKNHFDQNEKFLGWVYIKSSPDGSELPFFFYAMCTRRYECVFMLKFNWNCAM